VCIAKGRSRGECVSDQARFDPAAVDAPCGEQGNLVKHCGVDEDGFAQGVCNDLFDDYLCAKICVSDDECPKNDENCLYFFNKEDGIGFCSKPPPDDG